MRVYLIPSSSFETWVSLRYYNKNVKSKHLQGILSSHGESQNSHLRASEGKVCFLTLEAKANLVETQI